MSDVVSTHSRLKAADAGGGHNRLAGWVSTHSRLKAAARNPCFQSAHILFQHTAA